MRIPGLVPALFVLLVTSGCGSESCDCPPAFSASSVVDVNATNLAALGLQQGSTPSAGGSTTFVIGPMTPPMGTGSLQFTIGTDGNGGEQVGIPNFNGTRLDDLTALSFATFVQVSNGAQAPNVILRLDWDGNGTEDDRIYCEPVYQHGAISVPDQGALVTGAWQTWNGRTGGWWSLNDPALPASAGVQTIDFYLTLHPNATIVSGPTLPPAGIRIVAGFGSPSWDNFVGNADALTVGVNGVVTIYNFEP